MSSRRFLSAGLAALLLLAAPAAAQTGGESLPPSLSALLREKNPVVARVNGREIRWNDVIRSAADLPANAQAQVQLIFPALLGRLVDLQLLADAGRREGLLNDPAVQARLRAAEDRILQEVYVERLIAQAVTPAEIKRRVEVMTFAGEREELRLFAIFTDDLASAQEAQRLLARGTAFPKVAAAFSKGASAPQGGDLGWLAPAEIEPPELAAAAGALKNGQTSAQPLQTPLGWVILRVEGRRTVKAESQAALTQKIREQLGRLTIDKALVRLRAAAKIEIFPDR